MENITFLVLSSEDSFSAHLRGLFKESPAASALPVCRPDEVDSALEARPRFAVVDCRPGFGSQWAASVSMLSHEARLPVVCVTHLWTDSTYKEGEGVSKRPALFRGYVMRSLADATFENELQNFIHSDASSDPPILVEHPNAGPSLQWLHYGCERSSEPLMVLDSDWQVLYANPAALAYFQIDHDLLGRDLWANTTDRIRTIWKANQNSVLGKGVKEFEVHSDPAGSRERWRVEPRDDHVLLMIKKVSGGDSVEKASPPDFGREQLGKIGARFAHEFNNRMQIVLGAIAEAEEADASPRERREALARVRKALDTSKTIVSQLVPFAPGGRAVKHDLELNALVGRFLEGWTRCPNIDYQLDLAPGTITISGDARQLNCVLDSLITNAETALDARGTITLRTITANGASGLNALLEIEDDGPGIEPSILDQVKKPFFTTSDQSHATGLGLSACDEIAQHHGGALTLDRGRAGGTAVILCLPALKYEPEAPTAALMTGSPPALQVRQKILILDDEDGIRRLITKTLGRSGYRIEESADGSETVEKYISAMHEGSRYDLCILDLTIPGGTGGAEAWERIRQADPGAMGVVSSGYNDDPVMAHYQRHGFAAVLPKPYEPQSLLTLVNELLPKPNNGSTEK